MNNLKIMSDTADIAQNVGNLLDLLESWGHNVEGLRNQPTKLKEYRARHVQRQLAYIKRQKEKGLVSCNKVGRPTRKQRMEKCERWTQLMLSRQSFVNMLRSYEQQYQETGEVYYKLIMESLLESYEQGRRDGAKLREIERLKPKSSPAAVMHSTECKAARAENHA